MHHAGAGVQLSRALVLDEENKAEQSQRVSHPHRRYRDPFLRIMPRQSRTSRQG